MQTVVSFIHTVRGNMDGYMQREVKEVMPGHPTNQDFLGMVRSGMITNCPVSPTAVLNANRIFGPNLAGVRG